MEIEARRARYLQQTFDEKEFLVRADDVVAFSLAVFPRTELIDGSSFFFVWSFPSSLVSKVR
jgi:hypothetical protein